MGNNQNKTLPSPQDLVQQMRCVNWRDYFAAIVGVNNLDTLENLENEVDRLKDALRDTIAALCRELEKMPPDAVALCEKQLYDDDPQHKDAIVATVPYVLSILPRAHVSKRLKKNIRTILGLGSFFTTNLEWAGQWKTLRDGCRQILRTLGKPLEEAYQREKLRDLLGDYNPVPETSADNDDDVSGEITATATATSPPIAHATGGTRLRQFIPPQCQPSAFTPRFSVKNAELEAVYIHFLRLLATAMDDAFQRSVRDTLASATLAALVYSGGVKSYQRMFMKMKSDEDHGLLPPPRPAHNLDVVRCLVTFDTAKDMRKGFEVMEDVFSSGYLKFNNGHQWSSEKAAERYFLRLVLSAGKFQFTARKTIGELRSDPYVQSLWRKYISSGTVPAFVDPQTWCQQANTALDWLQHLDDDTEMWMICEVQMLLRSATCLRSKMHEVYKVARAPTPEALDVDFRSYLQSYKAKAAFVAAGNTAFDVACRDGLPITVTRLLPEQLPEQVGRGLEIAATYARRTCVDVMTRNEQTTLTPEQLSTALRAVAKGDGERDLGKLTKLVSNAASLTANSGSSVVELEDELRSRIASRLLECGAAVDDADEINETALFLACARGHHRLVQLLIQAGACVDAAESTMGLTCLHVAATNGVVELLAKANADLNKVKNNGGSALEWHAGESNVGPLQALIRMKASVNHRRPTGVTALSIAVERGRMAAVTLLLQAKATVDLCSDRVGPLFKACENGHAPVVELLVGAKADLDLRNNNGDSPLNLACYVGHATVAGIMVDAGANYKDTDKTGISAVDQARQKGHNDVVEVLQDHIHRRENR